MFKDLTLRQFVDDTSSSKPAPGGGSVAALTAANGASLIAMLCNLTANKKGYEEHWEKMAQTAEYCTKTAQELLDYIDKDCAAFEGYMAALKMPKDTQEQADARKIKLDEAIVKATTVPLSLASTAAYLFTYADYAITYGNKTATSDGAIAVLLLKDAVKSALYNVKINLPSIKDEKQKRSVEEQAAELESYAENQEKIILEKVKL